MRSVLFPHAAPAAAGLLQKRVCNFSCGTASAVATKIALSRYPNVLIINSFIAEEHEDNRRFAADCEQWFGNPIVILRDERYGASTLEVWRQKRFIKGQNGAPCSKALKRDILSGWTFPLAGEVTVIGYTVEEQDRAEKLMDLFPQELFEFPLIEEGLTKSDCRAMVVRAGIELPAMSRKGYDNDNCIGCPKGGQNYWQHIRKDFPPQFVQISNLQQELGPGAYFLRFRSGPRKGERMSLLELPEGCGNMADEPSFSCSHLCELAEQSLAQETL